MRKAQILLTAIVLVGTSNCCTHGAIVYDLSQATFGNPQFAFSGTFTTDGTLGTFQPTDASFITSWNITLSTPGGNDGITNQVLTPSNSTVSFQNLTPRFTASQNNFLFLSSLSPSSADIVFESGDVQFQIRSPRQSSPGIFVAGSYFLQDASEAPDASLMQFGSSSSMEFGINGTAVPEPSYILLLAFVTTFATRRTKCRAGHFDSA